MHILSHVIASLRGDFNMSRSCSAGVSHSFRSVVSTKQRILGIGRLAARRALLPVLLLIPAVVGTSEQAGAASAQPAAASSICSAATNVAVRSFAGTYSGGDALRAEREWAREPAFRSYVSKAPGARLGSTARDRASLLSYFRARIRAHERLAIVRLHLVYDPDRKFVHFSGSLVRSADDLSPPRRQTFTGAADCSPARPRLVAWNM
jgi:hypothetical protein